MSNKVCQRATLQLSDLMAYRARIITIVTLIGCATLLARPLLSMFSIKGALADVAQAMDEGGLHFEKIRTLTCPDWILAVGWSPDGQMLATFSDYGTLTTLWSADGARLRSFKRSCAK